MAKYRSTFNVREPSIFDKVYAFGRGIVGPFMFGIGGLAYVIGWLWGEMDTGKEISNSKPGVKAPSSYIIVGNLDDIWDDSK